MPLAIDRFVTLRLAANGDHSIRLRSRAHPEQPEFARDGWRDRWASHGDPASLGWAAYPLGVVWALAEEGYPIPAGFDAEFDSNLPVGAGLSSSAAVEVATAAALRAVFRFPLDDVALALACHRAEDHFVGVHCGIMDQCVCALGRSDHALLLDCRTRRIEPVPLPLGGKAAVVLCDTGVKHRLVDSPYNRRRQECREAVRLLAESLPGVRALRDVDVPAWTACESRIPPLLRRRARHVVTENDRVLRAAERLAAGDLDGVGRLLDASHDSLRDDYEVSCPELDCLVSAARASGDALGSRLTGAGFGGCTIHLVRAGRTEPFLRALEETYRREFGRPLRAIVCRAVDGAVRNVRPA
jgi:galactokinase